MLMAPISYQMRDMSDQLTDARALPQNPVELIYEKGRGFKLFVVDVSSAFSSE